MKTDKRRNKWKENKKLLFVYVFRGKQTYTYTWHDIYENKHKRNCWMLAIKRFYLRKSRFAAGYLLVCCRCCWLVFAFILRYFRALNKIWSASRLHTIHFSLLWMILLTFALLSTEWVCRCNLSMERRKKTREMGCKKRKTFQLFLSVDRCKQATFASIEYFSTVWMFQIKFVLFTVF